MTDELKRLLTPLQTARPDPAEVDRWSEMLRHGRRSHQGLAMALVASFIVVAAPLLLLRPHATPPPVDVVTAGAADSELASMMRDEARLMRRILARLLDADLEVFIAETRPHAADSEHARLMIREGQLMREILDQVQGE